MASVKIKFRKSKFKSGKGSCFIQLIHKRKMTTVATGIKLSGKEWDSRKSCVIFGKATAKRVKELLAIQERLEKIAGIFENMIAEKVNNQIDFTVDMLVQEYKKKDFTESFFALMKRRIVQLEEAGQKRTAINYQSTLKRFKMFRQGQDISCKDLTELVVGEFEVFLKRENCSLNTISYYMRILKAVYNYGVKKQWIKENQYPFRNVFTGMEKTAKRAVEGEVVQQLINLDLHHSPELDQAKDMFLFSLYTRGMSFIDVANLKKTDINGNVLVYKRHKTNQRMQVSLTACAWQIIKKYTEVMGKSVFLFPLLYNPEKQKHTVYASTLHLYNERLKVISDMLQLTVHLTSYIARHTWATLAKRNGVEVHVISEAMGHTSENTTRIYLASLNNVILDKANEIVINSVETFHKDKLRKLK